MKQFIGLFMRLILTILIAINLNKPKQGYHNAGP